MLKSMLRIVAPAAALAVAIGVPSATVAQQSDQMSDSDYIAKVMTGAPASVVHSATIFRITKSGKRTLQYGTDGFTCGLTTKGPVCADEGALQWMRAIANHGTPPTVAGFAYMLGGDSGSSNTDPDADGPTPANHWMKTGPNVMIFGPTVKQMGYPTEPDSDPSRPYVMWAGTPYAHLMIPVSVP